MANLDMAVTRLIMLFISLASPLIDPTIDPEIYTISRSLGPRLKMWARVLEVCMQACMCVLPILKKMLGNNVFVCAFTACTCIHRKYLCIEM